MSPGCADMAGLLVVPVEQEFARIDRPLLESMLSEVSIGRKGEALMVERTDPRTAEGRGRHNVREDAQVRDIDGRGRTEDSSLQGREK